MIRQLGQPRWLLFTLGVFLLSVLAGWGYYTGRDLRSIAAGWAAGVAVLMVLFLNSLRAAHRAARTAPVQTGLEPIPSSSIPQHQDTLCQLAKQLTNSSSEKDICNALFSGIHLILPEAALRLVIKDASSGGWMQFESATDGRFQSVLLAVSDSPATDLPATDETKSYHHRAILGNAENPRGILHIEKNSAAIKSEEQHFLDGAANLALLAFQKVQMRADITREQNEMVARYTEMRLSEQALKLFMQLSEAGARLQDFANMLQSLADRAGQFFRCDGVLIFLWDARHAASGRQARPVAAYGALRQVFRSMQINIADIPCLQDLSQTDEHVVVDDASHSMHIRARAAAQLQARSILVVPLRAGGEDSGVILFTYQNLHTFLPDEIQLATLTTQQISLAIAHTQALQTAQNRAHELSALQKATAVLMSNLDLESLLGQILDAAISAIPSAERGALHLIARDTGQLQVRAVQGYRDPRFRMLSMTQGSNFAARAVHERRPILVEDIQADPANQQTNPGENDDAGSSIIAPLILGDETLGAISLDTFRRYAFNQNDLNLLGSFAATAATAIKNAQLHGEVQKQAITDTLTGLYNRRGFYELGRREIERATRFNRHLSALMLDLDIFKEINDRHGHLFGDKVLINVTQRWSQELRQIDLLGRYGGDEFVALLPETDLENAHQVGERLRRTVNQMGFPYGLQIVNITMSVGVAALDAETRDLETLVQKADQALYEAKRNGRNQVVSK